MLPRLAQLAHDGHVSLWSSDGRKGSYPKMLDSRLARSSVSSARLSRGGTGFDEGHVVGGASPVAEVVERLRVLVVAGVPVGVVVVGIGSRLAMLLLRLTSPERVRGVESDDGFTIGQVTLAGSYNLLVLGAAVGIVGAAVYRAVAPWLIGRTWFRRFTTASASGAVVGSMLIHADGVDFTVLRPTWLAIALFVALPATFGALIGPAVDSVSAPGSPTATGRRRLTLPIVLLACFPPTLILLPFAAAMLAGSVALRRALPRAVPITVRFAMRAIWLSIAVAGLVALLRDIESIA